MCYKYQCSLWGSSHNCSQQWLKETVRGHICDLRRFKEQRTVMAKNKFPKDDVWLMQQVLPILKAQRTFPPTSNKVLKHMPIILMPNRFTSLPLTLSHFLTYKYFTFYVIKSIDISFHFFHCFYA